MAANGYSAPAIKALWDILVPFSDYAFNKAHTAAYGMVSYWTAYLKANYPAEFMAALLTSVADDKDKIAIYLDECRRMGIQVLPPDVNESAANFTPVGTDIRFGLTAVRNVGSQRGRRHRRGPRGARQGGQLLRLPRRRAAGGLQQAGDRVADQGGRVRLDGPHPAGADERATRAPSTGCSTSSATRRTARTTCSGDARRRRGLTPVLIGTVPGPPDWDKRTKLAFEREMLGLYVSDHPLQGLEHVLAAERDIGIGELIADDGPREGQVTIAGMITSVTRKTTRRGDIWAVHHRRGPGGLDRGAAVPQGVRRWSPPCWPPTPWCKVKGRVKVRRRLGLAERVGADPARRDRGADRAGGDLAAGGAVHAAGGAAAVARC